MFQKRQVRVDMGKIVDTKTTLETNSAPAVSASTGVEGRSEFQKGQQNLSGLTQEDEQLLMRFLDGECSWLSSLKASCVIKSRPEAKLYINSLRQAGKIVRAEQAGPVDLWDKISQRIDAEERAAVFLGRRNVEINNEPTQSGVFAAIARGRLLASERLQWALGGGLTGSLVAAAVTFFVIGVERAPMMAATSNSNQQVAMSSISANVKSPGTRDAVRHPPRVREPVSIGLVSNNSNSPELGAWDDPTMVSSLAPVPMRPRSRVAGQNVVEVDWVKSDGTVRMMQDSSQKAAIIWVTRRDQTNLMAPRPRRSFSTPIAAIPHVENRIPEAIPAYNLR